MADRWTHDRGRGEESLRQRYDVGFGRDRWGAAGGYEYGGGARGQEERTFRGYDNERDDDREYGDARVFGERETGASYGRGYGGSRTRGGRYYGDTGRDYPGSRFGDDPRLSAYRDDYGRRGGRRMFDGRGNGYDIDHSREAGEWSPGDGGYSRFGFGFDLDDDRFETRRGEGRGRHHGRGPEGYKRSDARISEDIHDRLTDDDDLDASTIQVQVAEAEVTLSGKVATRIDKHRAEHIVESVSGVDHVQNNLRVDRSLAHGPHGHLDNDYDRVKSVADGKN